MSFWELQTAFRAQNPPQNRRIRPWARLRDILRRSSGRPIRVSRPKGRVLDGAIRAGGSSAPGGGNWPPAPPEPPSGQTRRVRGCAPDPGRDVPSDEWRTPPPDAGAVPWQTPPRLPAPARRPSGIPSSARHSRPARHPEPGGSPDCETRGQSCTPASPDTAPRPPAPWAPHNRHHDLPT